ncbi:MAG: hypothetical protein MI753_10055, partial [Hyphomicrobiales bacterium]|nr:hypothetical protein [Hyphomicrobiales bacterium]
KRGKRRRTHETHERRAVQLPAEAGTVPEAVPSRDRVQRPRLNGSITKRAGRSIAGGIFDGMSKLPHQETDETQ